MELLSLQFEVVVCDEQVNNSLDVNTETEVEVRLLDEVAEKSIKQELRNN